MGIKTKDAERFLPKGFEMDPCFSDTAECSEKHVRYMLSIVWPILDSYRRVLVSQRQMTTYTTMGMFAVGDTDLGHLSPGHISLLDYPGKGKTILAKVPALAVGGTFGRIQGAPDKLPSDITGNRILDYDTDGKRVFVLEKGPVFSDFLLADEVNRLSPRTQSALLEVLGEGSVTIFRETHQASPFVIFTANPVESEGTYPMSDALLDRIMFQVVGNQFPSGVYKEILDRTDTFDSIQLQQVCTVEDVNTVRKFFFKNVYISPDVRNLIGRVCEFLNTSHRYDFLSDLEIQFGGKKRRKIIDYAISGRGAVHLKGASRVMAAFRYREYVTPDDVYKVLLPILRHRVIFVRGALEFFKEEWGHTNILTTRDKIISTLLQRVWQ